jgi:two-component system, response regulator PdtaR
MNVDRLRVLIADDEAIIRLDLREILSSMGHEVVGEAATGEEVVLLSRLLNPDLVFLDIKMPGLDGLAALRQMNEERLRAVIMLTAFDDSALLEAALNLGVAAYIVKPFVPSGLPSAIRVSMRHFEELESLRSQNQSLQETIEVSKLVNRAKALMAEREDMSEADAFRSIQKLSMNKNRKMKDVAKAIILLYSET